MAIVIERDRIRIALNSQDRGSEGGSSDIVTGESPRGWVRTDLQFEFGIFQETELALLSNMASVQVTVKPAANRRASAVLRKTITSADLNLTLTAEQWEAGTHQHFKVAFTNAETAIDLNGLTEAEFFLSVVGYTTDVPSRRIPLGTCRFVLEDDGSEDADDAATPIGASLIPSPSVYSGAGEFTLGNLVAGNHYSWAKGTNDTDVVNGAQTISASGTFIAQGTSVLLRGTAGQLVTAVMRHPVGATLDDLQAALAGALRVINAPGVNTGWVSENGKFLVLQGARNDGTGLFTKIQQIIPD